MLLPFALLGKGWGKFCKSLLELSGSYSLVHDKDLKSKRSSALDPPAINISAPWQKPRAKEWSCLPGCEKHVEVSGESALPFQGVRKVLARALSPQGLFFQCGTVRILLTTSFFRMVPH